jgi:hypothetical protein
MAKDDRAREMAKWKRVIAKELTKRLFANKSFLAAAARRTGRAREEFMRTAWCRLWRRFMDRHVRRAVDRVDCQARQSARPDGVAFPTDYVLAMDADRRIGSKSASVVDFRMMLAYEATAGVVPEDELAARRRDLELLTPFWSEGARMSEAVAAFLAAHPED